jgi:hypothetical protein
LLRVHACVQLTLLLFSSSTLQRIFFFIIQRTSILCQGGPFHGE